ncbi:hypothetical protein BDQ17DRAFT_1346922 [Cyathus striatus]|nr:hypothetical protein BDQ17DRAFT_1346922 [Cyathus striatus]
MRLQCDIPLPLSMSSQPHARLLPPELSREVVNYVHNRRDILNVRQICKSFFQPATEKAFRVLKICPDYEKSARGICKLGKHSNVVEYVEEIVFFENCRDEEQKDSRLDVHDSDADAMTELNPLHDALSSLHLFPGLKSVGLHFKETWEEEDVLDDPAEEEGYSDHLKLQVSIFDALTKNKAHNIKELEMRGVSAFPTKTMASKEFGAFVGGFRSLKVGVISEDFEQVYCSPIFFGFWGVDSPATFPTMLGYARNLVELKIASQGEYAPGYVGLDTLFFPQLEKLHLGYFIFFGGLDKGPEGFISRHRKTLKYLIIDDCYMERDSEDTNIPNRLWADVWRDFGLVMSALKDITVLSIRYIYLDDGPELERLQAVLKSR